MNNKSNDNLQSNTVMQDIYKSMYHMKSNNKSEKAYVKKEEEYKDIFTSGITFLTVSLLGILLLVLNLFDVIIIFYGLLPFLIMGSLFLSFFVIGLLSLKKAFIVKEQIHEEERITAVIKEWLHDNMNKEDLFHKLVDVYELNEKYYITIEYIRELIISQFGELDDSYMDYLIEEFYEEMFHY